MDGHRGGVHPETFRTWKLRPFPYWTVLRYAGNPVSCPSFLIILRGLSERSERMSPALSNGAPFDVYTSNTLFSITLLKL